ncbi:hypothetical protein BS50DRAFT_147413 [Corynespora cassiicola Philippines]|uniref:Uncharacterized protein n=1 Tax=Corynespora cassiicola Philippines TaxID=1448308 RepID=A0A2T2N8T4_CORCC|nr:hypothetical protein BS50DRAFT_147413 [Corynespora cassiicola Philippines]
MSWSGPVAGTAPYQQPTYTPGQSGYAQPQNYQYGQQASYGQYPGAPTYPPPAGPPQRPPDNRPPKKKGNPIITRYPPPPGYRGPAQAQAPFGTNQFSPPQTGYPQGPAAPPNYPNQGFPPQPYSSSPSQPQQPAYPQPGYPQGANYQWPQQNYPATQPYSQAPGYPGTQGHAPTNGYQGYPQSAPADANHQAYGQSQNWQPPNSQPPYPPSSYGAPPNVITTADPNATPTPATAQIVTSQGPQQPSQAESTAGDNVSGEKPQLFLAWDDWDFDFDGAIWPKANEPVDPNLSLGVIIWRPAKQVTRALPSTYDDAEEQALKPPAEKLGNAESVSIYFTTENSHEAYLDVRQTDDWDKIKDDPVFVVFTDEKMKEDLIPIEDCIAMRDRPDEPVEEEKELEDEEMHDSSWNVMDNLEQALSGQDKEAKRSTPGHDTSSVKPQTQEDILAMLGVTGSPKPPSDEAVAVPFPIGSEKPPPSLPEKPPAPQLHQIPARPEQPPQRAQSYGGHRNPPYSTPIQRPYGSMSASSRPSQSQERPRYDLWAPTIPEKQSSGFFTDGTQQSPISEGSNRTLAGSDPEETRPPSGAEKAPGHVPHLKRSDSSLTRKRSYDDTDQDDEKTRQQDDHMRRKRRSQVAPAYSRR